MPPFTLTTTVINFKSIALSGYPRTCQGSEKRWHCSHAFRQGASPQRVLFCTPGEHAHHTIFTHGRSQHEPHSWLVFVHPLTSSMPTLDLKARRWRASNPAAR
jgi:hypothetical protein